MRIFFSVGEPSGDQHAAHLIHELRRRYPQLQACGFGGPEMRETGADLLYPLTDLAVVGIVAVLPLLRKFIRLAKLAGEEFDRNRPDAVVLVDFPGFNWWIARAAKKRGIRVLYYCPPQIWAWAPWRIRKMRRFVDHLLCCLSFETQWFRDRGMSAEFVGHPFFDEVAQKQLDAKFLARVKTDSPQQRLIGILPGSRNYEVRHNFPLQIQVMQRLSQRFPQLKFLVACYKEHQREMCQTFLSEAHADLNVELHVGKASEIISSVECCLMVSGSISLELLARGCPAVGMYHADRLFATIARLLVTCRWFSLPNLMAGRTLIPEFPLCGRAQRGVAEMTETLANWLSDATLLECKRHELAELRQSVAIPGATACAANAILRQLVATQPKTESAPARAA